MTNTKYPSRWAPYHVLSTPFLAGLGLLTVLGAQPAHADIRADVTHCAAIADDAARLACYDTAAVDMQSERNAAAADAEEALAKEFRFDRSMLTGPLFLKVEVSGNLRVSRATFASSEVEETVRRVTKALGEISGWSLAITVHGGKVSLSRGSPYSGQELLIQAQSGAERAGLPEDRYTITLGADAEPELWDDGRVRSANEHIDIVVTGLGATGAR